MKNFIKTYKHGIPIVIYMLVYLGCFFILEHRPVEHFAIIHMKLDDMIPFCEYFVIPYFCWFAYVALSVLYMIFFDKDEYFRLFTTLVVGMTIFLFISAVWPNMHELRPVISELGRDNFFTRLVAGLYETDTCTNLIPSIHVYNSIMVEISVINSSKLRKVMWVRVASLILCVLIIMSTVMIKQHSLWDVFTGMILALIMYLVVYAGKLNFFKMKPLNKLA